MAVLIFILFELGKREAYKQLLLFTLISLLPRNNGDSAQAYSLTRNEKDNLIKKKRR
jgi:hypothetical protein